MKLNYETMKLSSMKPEGRADSVIILFRFIATRDYFHIVKLLRGMEF